MTTPEDLYAGFQQGKEYRSEASEKWSEKKIVQSEVALLKLTKDDLSDLKDRFAVVWKQLYEMCHMDPASAEVQALIKIHYDCITQFWGKPPSAEAYKGLGAMYVSDERYTTVDGKPQPAFAEFLKQTMAYFAKNLPSG